MTTYQLTEEQLSKLKGRAVGQGLLVGLCIATILFIFVLMCFTAPNALWHKEAIENNAAHYDAKTGAFTWNHLAEAKPK